MNLLSIKKSITYPTVIAIVFLCLSYHHSMAQSSASVDVLRSKIADNNQKIQDLQNQIDQYSKLLDSTSKQAQTLTNTLKSLELTQKKLEASLALTTQKISQANTTLAGLSREITSTKNAIASVSAAIAESFRQTQIAESQSVIEQLLNYKSISQAWDYINAVHSLQTKIKGKFDDLRKLQTTLQTKQDQATAEKSNLETYQKNLSDQKQVIVVSKQEKNQLLSDTNSREAAYSKILAEKINQKAIYEKELFDYESQLKITISPGSIPDAHPGLLSWPLDIVQITQYFGKTVSAKRLYVSGTHNGIDFRASIGTPVHVALSGIVTDTEPTKTRSGCQYGKFVLVKHANGMSTIYGHLSVVSVKPGDTVITGDTIGYSGDTGYATGPHLHMGLYITSGIRIVDSSILGSTRCAGIKTVASPLNGYLDPMAYLPNL